MRYIQTILLFSACILVAACSNQAVYTSESFADDSPFKMRADAEIAPACESARRALLGQGYLIESANEEGIKARKATRGGETQNTFIEMTVVCLPDPTGSSLFATGVLTTYALKKSTSSASVGLSALGSISLPIGQSADSLVKVSEETIDDKDFYGRFFAAVSTILDEMESGKAPLEVATETPAEPESAPEPQAAPAAPAIPSEHPAAAQVTQPGTPAPETAAPAITPTTATIAEELGPAPPVPAPLPASGESTTPTVLSAEPAMGEQPPTSMPEPGGITTAPPLEPSRSTDAATTSSEPVAETQAPAILPEATAPEEELAPITVQQPKRATQATEDPDPAEDSYFLF